MKIRLIQSKETFGPPERQEELRECWRRNEGLFDECMDFQARPTVGELLELFKPDTINVLCNSDIFFDEEFTRQVQEYFRNPARRMHALVLSRWDIGEGTTTHWNHRDSSDTWVVYGKPPKMDIPWPLGTPGIDNRIPWELERAGYHCTNPSKTIKTFHLHRCQWRSYLQDPSGVARGGDKIFRVPPPYKMVQPTEL